MFTRTAVRLDPLRVKYPAIEVAANVTELATKAKYIFICTKALDVIQIIDQMKGTVLPETHIISTSGTVRADYIHKSTGSMVSKLIPSVTSEVNDGVSLIYHENVIRKEDADFIEKLLGSIGKVQILEEDNFELLTEITSCGPGLIAGIFKEFLEAAVRYSNLYSREELQDMLIKTLFGTAKLFLEKELSFEDTISRVATKGGITEEGILVLQNRLPEVFNEMFDKTLDKRKVISKKVEDILIK